MQLSAAEASSLVTDKGLALCMTSLPLWHPTDISLPLHVWSIFAQAGAVETTTSAAIPAINKRLIVFMLVSSEWPLWAVESHTEAAHRPLGLRLSQYGVRGFR